ncbi:STAS/SEC14 domain-containing protein [Sorangium sp. So ce385]|uniref:STAS/SEC14 domain-containing protein n=1 Tax=Sorangium sp. So ce385 TaxID=3133308 RepID=UPI003F5B97E3
MSDVDAKGARLDLHEGPDGILYIALHGDMSEDMMRAMMAALRRTVEGGREVLVLGDLRRAGVIPALARKMAAEEMRTARLDAAAAVGASFSVRVVVTLVTKGVQLLTGRPYPLEFFDSESEARAWLLAQRDALRGKRRPAV